MFALKEYALDRIGKKRMPICRICDPTKGFTNWTEFNAHQVHRHGGLDKYKCHYEGCTKELKSLSGFQNHIFYHEDKKKWQCNIGKQKFTFESQLSRHQSTHTDRKPFKHTNKTCPKFKEGFKSQQALDRHMDVHKGKLLKCDIQGCTKSFSMCNYLRDHKKKSMGSHTSASTFWMAAHLNANHAKHFWTTINFSVLSIQIDDVN